MASLAPWVTQQFFDANGDPLSAGKVFTYSAGTVIPINTYTDATEATINSNPIILDASGSASIWLKDGVSYKFVIKNSNDVIIRTRDYVTSSGSGGVTPPADQFIYKIESWATWKHFLENVDTDVKYAVWMIDGANTLSNPTVPEVINVVGKELIVLPSNDVNISQMNVTYNGNQHAPANIKFYAPQVNFSAGVGGGFTLSGPKMFVRKYTCAGDCVITLNYASSITYQDKVFGIPYGPQDWWSESYQGAPPTQDAFVKVTSADTTANYLGDKLVGSANVGVNVLNPGGNESLEVSVDLSGYVPYLPKVGTASVNLGQNDLSLNALYLNNASGESSDATLDTVAGDAYFVNELSNNNCRVEVNADGSVKLKTDYYPEVAVTTNDARLHCETSDAYVNSAGSYSKHRNSYIHVNDDECKMYFDDRFGPWYTSLLCNDRRIQGLSHNGTYTGELFIQPSVAFLQTDEPDSSVWLQTDTECVSLHDGKTSLRSLMGGVGGEMALIDVDGAFYRGSVPISNVDTLTKISYSLSGVVAVPQTMKHEIGFSPANAWYLPTPITATLIGVGIHGRSVTSSAIGQTVKVKLFAWDTLNTIQRGVGAGVQYGPEFTLYTSAITGTRWELGSGTGVLSTPIALTSGKSYYLDISTLNLTMDDVTVSLYMTQVV